MRISMTEFCAIVNKSHNKVLVGVSYDKMDKDPL